MDRSAIPAALVALAAPLFAGAADPRGLDGVEVAQLMIHERIVVRVRRVDAAPAPQPVKWKESGGPRCISLGDLAGSLVTEHNAVDLVFWGGRRMRAKLDGECRSLDYYPDIYLKPAADGQICARRDIFRTRSGASCAIAKFRMLSIKK